MAVDSTTGYLYAGSFYNGVFISKDHGSSWTSASSGIEYPAVVCIAANSTYVYAGTSLTGIYRSSDYGESWSAVNSGLTNTQIGTLAFKDDLIFAGTKKGIAISTDNGDN